MKSGQEMARIFSVDFEFEEQRYTALVSLYNGENGSPTFKVAPTDEYLRKMLPDGQIKFSSLAEIRGGDRSAKLHELMLSLASAVHRKVYADDIDLL